jgi:hypothetical protein
MPITVAAQSKAWTGSARSNAGIVSSNPNEDVDVCIVCIYSVLMLFCVLVEALRRADPTSKESYLLCIGSRNWKSGQDPTKGCRAIKIRIIITEHIRRNVTTRRCTWFQFQLRKPIWLKSCLRYYLAEKLCHWKDVSLSPLPPIINVVMNSKNYEL